VYQQNGSGFGGLSTIACASPYYNGLSSATFHVQAGTTYYIQVWGQQGTVGTYILMVSVVS